MDFHGPVDVIVVDIVVVDAADLVALIDTPSIELENQVLFLLTWVHSTHLSIILITLT